MPHVEPGMHSEQKDPCDGSTRQNVSGAKITALDPSGYRRTPWKNGGGVAIDIAGESRLGSDPIGWGASLWRFGRTTISTGAPFSDLTGFDRLQMVVVGHGLVLETPSEEIDVRDPFVAVRFKGETAIVSRLEAGTVEVVNLIAARSYAEIDLALLDESRARGLAPGCHVVYAPLEACVLRCERDLHELAGGHALQLDCDRTVAVEGVSGRMVVASVFPTRGSDRLDIRDRDPLR